MKKLYISDSPINGKGLFLREDVKEGEHIAYVTGPIYVFKRITDEISKKMENWIGVGRYSWINTDDSPFKYVNHSCEPNAALVTKRKVIAAKDIPKGAELTMDYSLTEAEPGWELKQCNCGSTKCRGVIGPITTIPKNTFNKYRQLIPKSFQRVYECDFNK